MDVRIAPALEAQLTELSAKTGRAPDELVQEAVERLLQLNQSYDEWFIREVEKGLAAADRGEFVEHKDVENLLQGRYPR